MISPSRETIARSPADACAAAPVARRIALGGAAVCLERAHANFPLHRSFLHAASFTWPSVRIARLVG